MKVIHIIDSLATGGVNSFVYDLSRAQQKSGIDVNIIVILKRAKMTENSPVPEEIPVLYLDAPDKKTAVIRYIPKLRRLIKGVAGSDKTICNLHLKLSVLVGGLACAGMKNVGCVETYHNSYHHYQLEFFFMQPFIKKYITVSKTAQQEMFDRFHAPRDKVIAIPNGLDREEIRNSVTKRYEHDYIQIISVGRLAYPKNLFVPVEALSAICNEKCRYIIIGDGEERPKVEAARKGNSYITLLGNLSREKVLQHLASSDILIMSSLWEGRSISQLEAMAFDLPMIISDVPGLREPFSAKPLQNIKWRRCEFGYLVSTTDTEGYFRAIQDFVEHSDLIDGMRKYVRTISRENDSTIMVDHYMRVYESIMS